MLWIKKRRVILGSPTSYTLTVVLNFVNDSTAGIASNEPADLGGIVVWAKVVVANSGS